MKPLLDGRCVLSRFCALLLLAGLLPVAHPALAQATRVMFLHHSVGEGLVAGGRVREGLTALGYEFYDHGYNEEGLRLADGSTTGTNFDVPDDNTDPDGFAAIFAQPLHDPPDNAFSHLMQYDVIAFKSCYPTSNIGDDQQLADYRTYYLSIRDRMDQHRDKVFIVVTPPPQVPGASDSEEAARARAFADWLGSDEFLAGHPNVFTFDFFGRLAGSGNFLRPEYRVDNDDAHPNDRANREIGPLFVDFIDQAILSYQGAGTQPTAAAATAPAEAPAQPPEESSEAAAGMPPNEVGVIDDFETMAGHWESDAETESSVECGPTIGTVRSGTGSLRVRHNIAPDGWGDCARIFEDLQDWSAGTGISFWLRSDRTVEWLTLMVFSGAPDGPTPFEVDVQIAPGDWTPFFISWSDFDRAVWADETGLTELDPTRVTGYGLSVGAAEDGGEGNLWVDDVTLASGAAALEAGPTAAATSEPGDADEGVSGAGGDDEAAGGGFCPFGAAVLPLGLLGIALRGWLNRSVDDGQFR